MKKEKTKSPLAFHDNIFAFLDALQRETDRGLILSTGDWLDEQLKVYLKAFFVDDEDAVHQIESRALETFSSRIELTYLCGLINADQRKDLNTIREMRNQCAHTYEAIDFQNPCLQQLCLNLRALDLLEEKLGAKDYKKEGTRGRFTNSTIFLSVGISIRMGSINHQTAAFSKPGESLIKGTYKDVIGEMKKRRFDK